MGILHLFLDVGDMLLGGLVQLLGAMLQGALGKEVDGATTTVGYPVDRQAAINKAQHLYAVQTVYLTGIAANHRYGLLLAIRHTRRGHLDAVDIDLVQQFASHDEFLVWQETDAIGLFTITQRRVHNLDQRSDTLIAVYLLSCSPT